MKNKSYSFFRIATGAFLIENAFQLRPFWAEYFTHGRMIDRTSVFPNLPSIYDIWPKYISIELGFYIYLVCAFLFTFGYFNRFAVFLFWVINASLYTFNPYIVHEPQQLASFFLFSFLFLSPQKREQNDLFYLRVIMGFLSVYYLFAAAKKLPDPLWQNGQAVGQLLRNPAFSRWPNLFTWLEPDSVVSGLVTYGTLAIEFALAFLIFTRFWWIALMVGGVLHMSMQLLLEIGNFGWIMLVWYSVVVQYNLQKRAQAKAFQ